MLFKEIIGQEEVKKKLVQQVLENRVSHAQLFFGPGGVGKLPLAIAYAQFINCTNRQPDDSCGVCASCIKFAKYIHPDLHFIYPVNSTKSITKDKDISCFSSKFLEEWRTALIENNYMNLNQWYDFIGIENKQGIIKADDCNEIIRILGLTTYEAEYKIMIIWMVERLHHAAAPKLLKILEEPPEKTLFLLISENPDQIISTILSRAQMIKIPRITDYELKKTFQTKNQFAEEQIDYALKIAEGSYTDAVELLNSDAIDNNDLFMFRNWMLSNLQNEYIKMIDFIDEIAKVGREKQKSFFDYCLHMIRECEQLNCFDSPVPKLTDEEIAFANKFSKFVHIGNCTKMSEEINKASFNIERNANPKIIFLDLSLKLGQLLRQ